MPTADFENGGESSHYEASIGKAVLIPFSRQQAAGEQSEEADDIGVKDEELVGIDIIPLQSEDDSEEDDSEEDASGEKENSDDSNNLEPMISAYSEKDFTPTDELTNSGRHVN